MCRGAKRAHGPRPRRTGRAGVAGSGIPIRDLRPRREKNEETPRLRLYKALTSIYRRALVSSCIEHGELYRIHTPAHTSLELVTRLVHSPQLSFSPIAGALSAPHQRNPRAQHRRRGGVWGGVGVKPRRPPRHRGPCACPRAGPLTERPSLCGRGKIPGAVSGGARSCPRAV